MGQITNIEWVRSASGGKGATLNPIVADVSAAPPLPNGTPDKSRWACIHADLSCINCYADGLNQRWGGSAFAELGSKQPNTPVTLSRKALQEPARWIEPRMIFVGDMLDAWGEWVADEHLFAMLHAFIRVKRHTYLFLTKRPANMTRVVMTWMLHNGMHVLPENWWFGVSIGYQAMAWRLKPLIPLKIAGASVIFVSAEPLIGKVDLHDYMGVTTRDRWTLGGSLVNWVIAGGESGKAARAMDPNWARILRDECVAADIPFFFKQYGQWAPTGYGRVLTLPSGEVLFRQPHKYSGGRELDGHVWDEIPVVGRYGLARQPAVV